MLEDDVLKEALALPLPSPRAAERYAERSEAMREQVDREVAGRPDIGVLLGGNPIDVMRANHENHARFVATVFRIGRLDLLAKTVPWVYRAYHSHGFSYDYFPVELAAWRRAVTAHFPAEDAGAVLSIYEWLEARHPAMVELARAPATPRVTLNPAWENCRRAFLASLLRGDQRAAQRLAVEAVPDQTAFADFYDEVVRPAMTEVGLLWEHGEVSVAEEHLASALVSRCMASLYGRFLSSNPVHGVAVVTAVANEFHEVGARMVADVLEVEGWDVQYLGANTPARDLRDLCVAKRPALIALSVSMSFNLDSVQGIIADLRREPALGGARFVVGGRVFGEVEDLWVLTGADAWAPDLKSAVALARTLAGSGMRR